MHQGKKKLFLLRLALGNLGNPAWQVKLAGVSSSSFPCAKKRPCKRAKHINGTRKHPGEEGKKPEPADVRFYSVHSGTEFCERVQGTGTPNPPWAQPSFQEVLPSHRHRDPLEYTGNHVLEPAPSLGEAKARLNRTWHRRSCPCPRQRWHWMKFKVPLNPNHLQSCTTVRWSSTETHSECHSTQTKHLPALLGAVRAPAAKNFSKNLN